MDRAVDAEELMDADDIDAATFRDVLIDLDRANGYSLGYRPTLAFLDRLVARHRPEKLRILDVGSGSGWMLKEIDRWQIGRGIDVGMTGIDLNPRSEPIARSTTARDAPIDYRTGDYADLAGEQWDVVISSLVVHHMTQPQLIAFLRFMEANARLGWFVNDLRRSRLSQVLYGAASSAMGMHPIVRHDGRLSIARSYTPAEWPPLLADAGVTDARVFCTFPFRLCVERLR